MKPRILSQLLERIVLTLCEDADTPRALAVSLMVKAQEYHQLFSLKIDVANYLDSESYFKDCAVTEFLRKLELDIGVDREEVCSQTFLECERQNCSTNVRLSRFVNSGPFGPEDTPIIPVLGLIRKKVRDLLGSLPKDLDLRFGPGGTFEDRGRLSTIPDKMQSRPTVTKDARVLLPFWEATAWARTLYHDTPWHSDPKDVRGNRFTTVAKDALKRRGICVEPSINVSLQLAVGTHIRQRLKRAGLDLMSAQPLHRRLAQSASSRGHLATIDLSNASDTVSFQLVKLLLPPMWFDLLCSLRSPFTYFQGKWVRLEKFSSMGNGYTFELETLLFLAVSMVLTELCGSPVEVGCNVSVYGDDIIVPTDAAPSVVACLSFLGLTANRKKTFLSGPFRESCGGDFFHGVPVRAYYLKKDPCEPQHYIALANGLRQMSFGANGVAFERKFIKRSWHRVLDCLPLTISKLRGPQSFGDLVIHDDRNWSFRETYDGRGFIRTYSPVFKPLSWRYWTPYTILASALYGLPSRGVLEREHSVTGYRLEWTSCVEREASGVGPPGRVR